MQKKTNGKYAVTVNVRINGIVRHKTGWFDAGTPRGDVQIIKNDLIAQLHEQFDNVIEQCTSSSTNIPDEFKAYHKAQEEEYGYVKFKIERDESSGGRVFYSVHAMSKYGGYLRNKLNYVPEKEVVKFINDNPVETI
jgi:hypothetical protein